MTAPTRLDNVRRAYRKSFEEMGLALARAERRGAKAYAGMDLETLRAKVRDFKRCSEMTDEQLLEHLDASRIEMMQRLALLAGRA